VAVEVVPQLDLLAVVVGELGVERELRVQVLVDADVLQFGRQRLRAILRTRVGRAQGAQERQCQTERVGATMQSHGHDPAGRVLVGTDAGTAIVAGAVVGFPVCPPRSTKSCIARSMGMP